MTAIMSSWFVNCVWQSLFPPKKYCLHLGLYMPISCSTAVDTAASWRGEFRLACATVKFHDTDGVAMSKMHENAAEFDCRTRITGNMSPLSLSLYIYTLSILTLLFCRVGTDTSGFEEFWKIPRVLNGYFDEFNIVVLAIVELYLIYHDISWDTLGRIASRGSVCGHAQVLEMLVFGPKRANNLGSTECPQSDIHPKKS